MHNNIYTKMDTIVKEVMKKYPGGESYFNELDGLIKADEQLIVDVIDNLFDKYECSFVFSGEFGYKVWELYEAGKFRNVFSIILFNGGLRKGDEPHIDLILPVNENYCQNLMFVDDSYYSGKTFRAVQNALERYSMKCNNCFAFYDGSVDHMVESLYRYWR